MQTVLALHWRSVAVKDEPLCNLPDAVAMTMTPQRIQCKIDNKKAADIRDHHLQMPLYICLLEATQTESPPEHR